MAKEGTPRSHDAAWAEMLEGWRPPHRENDWSSPSMWRLLQAALRDPLFRSMYPWTSMSMLNVSEFDEFMDWGKESFPSIAAASGTYTVVAHPAREGRPLLETDDPAAAVSYMSRLVRQQRIGQATSAEEILRTAGWRPGRTIDITNWRTLLEAGGLQMHESASTFLREYGGLSIGNGGPGITSARETFELDPLLALGEEDRFLDWGDEIGRHLFPLGELCDGRFFLGMDEFSEIYLIETWIARFGPMPDGLDNLLLGVQPIDPRHAENDSA
ncbi:SUKH-3 domain-containing protein [Streptomyces sp. NPDC050738]|uniref:SUKH-3 domain-containing protein n=1 Tax=Streptomyces sp. NPDC050738 TaxID=3154744 RepID=UPI003414A81F